jgi:hypothetical protein
VSKKKGVAFLTPKDRTQDKLSPKKSRVGQNRIFTLHMTVYLVISLPKIPHIYCIYMVLANPQNMRGKEGLHASIDTELLSFINRDGQNPIYTPYITV